MSFIKCTLVLEKDPWKLLSVKLMVESLFHGFD